ncbi:MAG: DNA mismatch repair protein MutS [Bacteriovoracaceae bacterium]
MTTTIQDILKADVKLTPMMTQYFDIKKDYPDTIVVYRMGDFYELFFDDAKLASQILNITLTHRGKLGDFPIPMAGIPHHAASAYIDRITARGLKVVICEQIEDPKDAVGIVKRAVTQIVSPGMPYDLEKTGGAETRYMAAAYVDKSQKEKTQFVLVFLDFTTGDFSGYICGTEKELIEKLSLLSPREFLQHHGQWDQYNEFKEYLQKSPILKTTLAKEYFSHKENELYITKLIPHFKRDQILKENAAVLSPVGALSYYVFSTQSLENLYHIRPFRLEAKKGVMQATLSTLTSLEILPRGRENYNDSLLGFFDRTKTAVGARKLKELFLKPTMDLALIKKRQVTIEKLLQSAEALTFIREQLENIRDIERIMAKLTTKKINAQDLGNLSLAIKTYFQLKKGLDVKIRDHFHWLTTSAEKLLTELSEKIILTINLEIGAHLDKGNLIMVGASKERDRLSRLSVKANDELLKLENNYREKSGIGNLKIKFNNVNGYFIEVSKSHLTKVPKSFERRQTLVNSERFTTKELLEFEKEVITAQDKLLRLERDIFQNVLDLVATTCPALIDLTHFLAIIDVEQTFTFMAREENLVKPEFSHDKRLKVLGAWHPLIKSMIKDEFVTHDLKLTSEKYFGLVTGPNMAGKTTVMREMAIIQFLAQVGSFVPAKRAELSLCDALFSRLGASDDILRGQSTFMVEMTETAEILRHATAQSLIIIDEIGRGTSTYDGLSIAWALVEYFVNQTKGLTLFSTHYHELIELVNGLPEAKNLTVETVEKGGQVQFLYRLIEQGATQSFGIYVAKLAGLPRLVLERSTQILKELEDKEEVRAAMDFSNQLSFSLDESRVEEDSELKRSLEGIDLNSITPLQAMQKLHDLQKLI